MADDSKISIGELIEDDGTLQGVIRQIEDVITAIQKLNNIVKNEDLSKWLNGVKQGSNEYKIAMSAATSLAEKLIAATEKLAMLESEEGKELARLSQVIKDKTRDRQKEAEINSKVSGSYARMKLELQQLVEQYKNTTDISQKSKLADGITRLSNELMLADRELKNLMNDYTKLSATEQARLATLERERAASEAVAESVKKRAKADAELDNVYKNRGEVELTALAEQMRKVIEERIQLEAKELVLQDEFHAKELSSAEMIKQRLAIKEQLTQTEAKLKALEMQEANDLAIVKARVTMKQQQLDVEAKIIAAESQEGRNLAENEAKLKRIQQQNERNAQIATAVAGSYEHMKLTLQAKLDLLNKANMLQGGEFHSALAQVSAAQRQVKEAELWLNLTKQQANEWARLKVLKSDDYAYTLQESKELDLQIKYMQGLIDSRAKLNAMKQAATTYNDMGQSQLEEIRINEELAASIKKTADVRAKAAVAGTDEYRELLNAQNDLKQARLQAVTGMSSEEAATKLLNNELKVEEMSYNQLDALYRQVEMSMRNVTNTTEEGKSQYEAYKAVLDELIKKLNQMERQMGITSNRQSMRQREWDGLTNSVYQLTRELPNLAVRADTFFLAISNNIPIFIDELKRAKDEVGSLAGAWAKAGKAFIKSLPLAVLLLVLSKWSDMVKLYDKFFSTLSDGTLKVGAFYRNLSNHIKGATSEVMKQVVSVRSLSQEWKKLNTLDERQEFLVKYREELDATGLAINDMNTAEKALNTFTDTIVEAYFARAKAAAAASMAEEDYKKAIEAAFELEKEASNQRGRKTTQMDLRQAFASRYGLQDDASAVLSGNFTIDRQTFENISRSFGASGNPNVQDLRTYLAYMEYLRDLAATETAGVSRLLEDVIPMWGEDIVQKKLKEILEAYDRGDEKIVIDKYLADYFGSRELGVNIIPQIEKMAEAFAKGDQDLEAYNGYLEETKGLLSSTGIAAKDLTDKIEKLHAAALKAASKQELETMNNWSYANGGVNTNIGVYEAVYDETLEQQAKVVGQLKEKSKELRQILKEDANYYREQTARINEEQNEDIKASMQAELERRMAGFKEAKEAKEAEIRTLQQETSGFDMEAVENYIDSRGVKKVADESLTVLSSFDKGVKQANDALMITIAEYEEAIRQAQVLLTKVTDPTQRSKIENSISDYYLALYNAYKAYNDKANTIRNQTEPAALARVYADNVAMRLDAVKEGSEEELGLRIKSIRANMNAEIAENATQEQSLQKSVSAIRAKYRREEEQAEREWLIKRNNWRKQQLENENADELSLTLDYYSRRRQIQQIELENELLENAELIENGQIKQEDIIRKHLKAQENLWKEHRNAVLSSQKSMWDVVEELSTTDSYEQLAAQLNKYDIELEQTKLQQQEIIDLQIPQELKRIAKERADLVRQLEEQIGLSDEEINLINKQIKGLDDEALKYRALNNEIADYIKMLERLNEKRKSRAIAEMGQRNYETWLEASQVEWETNTFQAGERQSEIISLEVQKRSLNYQLQNWEALGKSVEEARLLAAQLEQVEQRQKAIAGWKGTVSAVANHGLAGLIQMPDKDNNGNIKRNSKGEIEWKDLSSDQYDAVNTALDTTKTYVNELMQSYVDLAQAAYDAAQAQVDAAKTAYEAELEARANGYANDVEGAKQELALERRKAKQKEQILKSAQKAQEHINTLQQISSLITGSAQILETFAAYPVIAGVLLAAMWGSFAAAKIKANQVANQSSSYGEGGFEVAVGGSHASGHDIKTGIKTTKGSQMVIEGGEGVGVFSRKAVTKYGDIIPNLVDSINDGSYSDVGNSQGSLDRLSPAATYSHMDFESAEPLVRTEYAKEIMAMQPITNETDLSAIEGKLDTLIKLQDNKQLVLNDGSIMERKGNKVTITRRG